jgi:cation:H+ antiporter
LSYLELVGGLVYLLMGGDLLVRGAVALGRRLHVSPMLIGVTIVALGTSAPELFVSVEAALTGHPAIALGNVVGSNIANMLLVAGCLAILTPIVTRASGTREDSGAMLIATTLLLLLCLGGRITRVEGLTLLIGLVLFMAYKARHLDRPRIREGRLDWVLGLPNTPWMIALFIFVGIAWLPLGAHLFIGAAAAIAQQLGVSEAVVGLTLVAVGTSLPELATVFVAAARKNTDLALGNVIGSNVLNILAILGAAAVIPERPLPVSGEFLTLHLPVMIAATVAISIFTLCRWTIGRAVGVLLLLAYALYVAALYDNGGISI